MDVSEEAAANEAAPMEAEATFTPTPIDPEQAAAARESAAKHAAKDAADFAALAAAKEAAERDAAAASVKAAITAKGVNLTTAELDTLLRAADFS